MTLYNDYATYLKAKYGCRVYKIAIDGGFSCPNRDGTKGRDGCLYCNDDGSRAAYADPKKSIKEQLVSRIEHLKKTKNASKFIAYFQAFTNTYSPIDTLKKRYDQMLGLDEIVGISIGTRPDAVDNDVMELIASYKKRYDVWMELGLQSTHDKTLEIISRGHTFEDFITGLAVIRKFDIPVCAHVILGLPGETREEMIETARTLSKLRVNGVKIHLLHVLKGSRLENPYNEGKIVLMTQDEYVGVACDFLENLSPDIIVERLTGEGDRANHIAPAWAMNKLDTIEHIKGELLRRGSRQGAKFNQYPVR